MPKPQKPCETTPEIPRDTSSPNPEPKGVRRGGATAGFNHKNPKTTGGANGSALWLLFFARIRSLRNLRTKTLKGLGNLPKKAPKAFALGAANFIRPVFT